MKKGGMPTYDHLLISRMINLPRVNHAHDWATVGLLILGHHHREPERVKLLCSSRDVIEFIDEDCTCIANLVVES